MPLRHSCFTVSNWARVCAIAGTPHCAVECGARKSLKHARLHAHQHFRVHTAFADTNMKIRTRAACAKRHFGDRGTLFLPVFLILPTRRVINNLAAQCSELYIPLRAACTRIFLYFFSLSLFLLHPLSLFVFVFCPSLSLFLPFPHFSLFCIPLFLCSISLRCTLRYTPHTHTHTHAHLRSGFKINTAFAARLTHNKQREEKHRLQEKYGENPDETDSESSDDSDADLLDAETEKDFFITLSKLKTNDPEIYNKEKSFFKKTKEELDAGAAAKKKAAGMAGDSKSAKPFSLKDHERKRLQTKGVNAFVSDDEDDEDAPPLPGSRSSTFAFNEEQRDLRKNLIKAMKGDGDADDDGEGDDGDDDDGDGLFRLRSKTTEEEEEEDNDYASWLQNSESLKDEGYVRS